MKLIARCVSAMTGEHFQVTVEPDDTGKIRAHCELRSYTDRDSGTANDAPRTLSWKRVVPQETASDWLVRLGRTRLPAFTTGEFGLDGTDFMLTVQDQSTAVEFTWWGRPPRGWRTLGAILDEILDLADPKSALMHDGLSRPTES